MFFIIREYYNIAKKIFNKGLSFIRKPIENSNSVTAWFIFFGFLTFFFGVILLIIFIGLTSLVLSAFLPSIILLFFWNIVMVEFFALPNISLIQSFLIVLFFSILAGFLNTIFRKKETEC